MCCSVAARAVTVYLFAAGWCGADMLYTHSQPAWQPRFNTLLLPATLCCCWWCGLRVLQGAWLQADTQLPGIALGVSELQPATAPARWRRCTLYFAMAADPAQCHLPCLPTFTSLPGVWMCDDVASASVEIRATLVVYSWPPALRLSPSGGCLVLFSFTLQW